MADLSKWKIVPLEPSAEMIRAAYDCVPERPQPMCTEGRFAPNNTLRVKEFKAMIQQLLKEVKP